MSAIKYKTIPVYYSKSGILYFDSLKTFDSKGFEYLKKTIAWNPIATYATHKINIVKSVEIINRKKDSKQSTLDKLILNINKMLTEGSINFGVPLGFQEGEVVSLDDNELENFIWKPKKINLITKTVNNATSSHFKGLVNVGHGLSFIDVDNSFMYDAGGSIGYSKFISRIPKISYDIVISHMHLDHYKFLDKLNKNGFVSSVLLPEKIYAGERIDKVLNTISSAETLSNSSAEPIIGGYKIMSPDPLKVIKSDLNTTSLIALGNDWLLTGDSRWDIIESRVGCIGHFTDVSVPHHGSPSAGTPNPSFLSPGKSFWVSYRHGVHKLPNASVDSKYDMIGNLHKVAG